MRSPKHMVASAISIPVHAHKDALFNLTVHEQHTHLHAFFLLRVARSVITGSAVVGGGSCVELNYPR